jgi:hypothetical protein
MTLLRRLDAATVAGAVLLAVALTSCSGTPSARSGQPAAAGTGAASTTGTLPTASTSTPSTTSPSPTTTSTPPAALPGTGATPAPAWLGTRVLPTGPDGFGIASTTPPELRDRRIITVDVLPPPADGRFHSRIVPVPAAVAKRSSWSASCPVKLSQLRYVTVSFRGFDGRAHTGELLVNADAASAMVKVFARLFAAGFPIERMQITTKAERDAPPTGDGNNTSAFVCRTAVGDRAWSQHAYGRAVDVDPFQNPYIKGDVVLPELARAYTDRTWARPGMIYARGPVVAAFRSVGWGWGGNFKTLKDYMHFSANGT